MGVTVELVQHAPDVAARSGRGQYGQLMTRGRLITIEGIDGTGKTTLAAALVGARGPGRRSGCSASPGGFGAAERVRELVTDPALHVTPRAEALLYAAARAQLVEEAIVPPGRPGRGFCWTGSSIPRWPTRGRAASAWSAVRAINDFGTGGRPDRTLLLLLDPGSPGADRVPRARPTAWSASSGSSSTGRRHLPRAALAGP